MILARSNLRSTIKGLRCSYATATSTTTSPGAPMLLKIREDMKSALKSKDKNRLDVLRGILAESLNQSKMSSKPISSDVQVVAILRRRAKASRSAAVEFSTANRDDLRDKEMAQVDVLDEYIQSVEVVGEEEIRGIVTETIDELKTEQRPINKGSVMKALVGPGGALGGRPVEMEKVAEIVKSMV